MNVYPRNLDDEAEWLNRISGNKDDIILAIEIKPDRTFIGTMGLHQINHIHGTAVTGTIIGSKDHWNQGCGSYINLLE